ncbi:uracil phosphoribosyltransferase [bacterium]|nr:uracil phosphoribosyltransferase [bacterium]
MNSTIVIEHPLVQHKLAQLRDKETDHHDFRRLTKELTAFMLYEVMADCPLRDVVVQTPLARAKARKLAREVSLVLILRAGLGMMEGVLELVPRARVGHIGLYRNENTLEPVQYYAKLPKNIANTDVILVDPMLATGGSAVLAVDIIKKARAHSVKFVCMVAAPEGIKRLQAAHPDVAIYAAAVDRRLNKHGYIVPGLGDAGDRLFGTK